jgi:hypothetical protein
MHLALIQITYTNPDKTPRFAELRVNGHAATRISFPPTGSGKGKGSIWIQAILHPDGASNVLAFSAPCNLGPDIESISVE